MSPILAHSGEVFVRPNAYVDKLADVHRLEFIEGAEDIRGIIDVAKAGTQPMVTREMQSKSFSEVFQLIHPGGPEAPLALRESDKRAAAVTRGNRQQAPASSGTSLIHADTAGEEQWFRNSFCDSQHNCAQHSGQTMFVTTPRPANNWEVIGMAPSEARTASTVAAFWLDCRSGTCAWNRLAGTALQPGYYASMTVGFSSCPGSAYFAASIDGDQQARYLLATTYWVCID